MDPITLFICGGEVDLETAFAEQITREAMRELDDLQRAEDRRLRLTEGSCDMCQEPADEPLVELGDEALCRGCSEALHGAGAYSEAVDFGAGPGAEADHG
jgi:hypothetical protein